MCICASLCVYITCMYSGGGGAGLEVCVLGVLFLRHVVRAPRVLNPFCGQGTILAVANHFGLPATGEEEGEEEEEEILIALC
jgi:hypothetical protein